MATTVLDIIVCENLLESEGRWFFGKDMNCDGLFTISDVGLWAKWVFFLPGDGLLWVVMQSQGAAIFFELTPEIYSGWYSGITSGFVWFIVMIFWVVMSESWD